MSDQVAGQSAETARTYRVSRLKGLRHLLRWLRNPVSFEGASQVPKMKMATGAPEFAARVADMRQHPVGQRILSDRPDLGAALGDPALAALPEASLGRHYHAHASVDGAVPGYMLSGLLYRGSEFDTLDWSQDMKYLLVRFNATHDLVHQLCGYGTDLAGEALTISYTLGLEAMQASGARRAARAWAGVSWLMMSPSIGWQRYRAHVMEAFERGLATSTTRAMHNIYFEEMLPQPLTAVREELGVPPLTQAVDTAQWRLSRLGQKIASGYRKAEDAAGMRMRNMDQLVRAGISVRTLVNLDEQVLADLLERVDAGADAEALRRFAEGRAVA
ncbi:hypothetical protein F0M18_07480 [Pseudohalioglobus sediminis]|uniref:Ubiquinone biosynthesis protein COQ4 n=1 Tax=Pseudohalioglobus sediminis TaxID=2606449 RepID=A0A5B0WZI7_9GAMM|nr:Coq4 family protein [Pseudohalioglobus sediminis]KAA1192504.1 hypothetical protein F0M18_07480 [Pseudohalioglobus sediminis]